MAAGCVCVLLKLILLTFPKPLNTCAEVLRLEGKFRTQDNFEILRK
jgi:hypothetical protein